jgi:hypothetical protein
MVGVTMPVVRPLDYPEIEGPLLFLAGPIRSARDWQQDAIEQISALVPKLWVASPRRVEGIELDAQLDDDEYTAQVNWENHHRHLAANYGVTLFWLAREDRHICRRAFAQTTRYELPETVAWHRYEGARVVIGIEEGFSGARYIRRRVSEYPGIALLDNLHETCLEAVSHAVAAGELAGTPIV